MSSITTELAKVLSAVQRPGDFYASGVTGMRAPRLEVEGVGPIALPLLPVQAQQLIAVAEQAPYGRGAETLIDSQVRRTWQIDEARVHLEGQGWTETLTNIVTWAAASLGVTGLVAAELYKLLIYDEGSFFVSHRDTEKAPGMFATLVIVLPSSYTGGELIVRHQDREQRLELYCEDPSEVAFAAFYADCSHEVLPITSGCRLTLVYNLLRRGKDPVPEPPNYAHEQAQAATLLRQWAADPAWLEGHAPAKLLYCLEHAYTEAELGFEALKGADITTTAVLIDAAKQADCDLHLALVSIYESGGAEYSGDYYSRRRRWRWRDDDDDDDDDYEFEAGEVFERNTTVSEWRAVDGGQPEWGDFPFDEQELCPPNAFAGLEPDELHFQEATGNEGASFDRTYLRAALVLWPRQRRLAVLNQAGLSATLPYLEELTERWIDGGKDPESPLWREVDELAGQMMLTWPLKGYDSRQVGFDSAAARMLDVLTRLNDRKRIAAFLADVSAAGDYGKGDNPAVMRAVGLLPPAQVAELIERVIAGNAVKGRGACADLLMRCASEAREVGRTTDFIPAATALIEALPGNPERVLPPEQRWWGSSTVEPDFVADLLTALSVLDQGLAGRAVDHLLAWPKTCGLDAVIVPAALTLTEAAPAAGGAAVQCLRDAALAHLNARIAEPLEPPRNWTRASAIACRCADCAQLSQFLADPERKTWTFKAAEPKRRHLAESIQRNACDVDCVTEKNGRPYGLVCTKNRASYEQRVQQRKKDLKDQARLAAGN